MSYLHDSEFDFHFHRDHPFPSLPPSILITGLGFHLLSSPAVGASAIIAFSYRGHVQAALEQVLEGGCGMGGVSSTRPLSHHPQVRQIPCISHEETSSPCRFREPLHHLELAHV
ncbi:hypothetical protein CEP51_007515 [Fusarium floridanum]|uniref:Uncharacterized protein n=1 Tax=Fusarium floridanum TaxID=1325733 RepID=A0A428RP06_9HYPO|nr:hypothetical protein CEP51_007515 [Fusarium floridanum]